MKKIIADVYCFYSVCFNGLFNILKKAATRTARIALVLIPSAAVLLTACKVAQSDLILYVQYPLEAVMKDITRLYKTSGQTKARITLGAPADFFASINTGQSNCNILLMQDGDLFAGLSSSNKVMKAEQFGRDHIVLIGSVSAKSAIKNQSEVAPLIGKERLGVADPNRLALGRDSVSILKYYNLYNDLKDQIKFITTIKGIVLTTELRQVNYAMVYKTYALASDSVKILYSFPQESYMPINYVMALTTYNYDDETKRFVKFFSSPEVQRLIVAYGFKEQ